MNCQQRLTVYDIKAIHIISHSLEHHLEIFDKSFSIILVFIRIIYEHIIWFEFMLGKCEMVIIPDLLNRSDLEHHFDNSSGW